MDAKTKPIDLSKAKSAGQFLAELLAVPENERLYREAETSLELSEYMRFLRKSAGLRQEDLAKRVGCTQSFIAKLEKGAYSRLGLDVLRTYARALSYDISVKAMLCRLEAPVYTGRCTYEELPDSVRFSDLVSGRFGALSAEVWQRDQQPIVECTPKPQDLGAAA